MSLALWAGIAAYAERLWQRAFSLVLPLCKQRKNKTIPKSKRRKKYLY
jgi:hypothetical protein